MYFAGGRERWDDAALSGVKSKQEATIGAAHAHAAIFLFLFFRTLPEMRSPVKKRKNK